MPEKLVCLIQRSPRLDRVEFCRRYLKEHATLVLRHYSNLRGYVVNLSEEEGEDNSGRPGADAVVELWLDSVEDFTDRSRRYGSPEGKAVVEETAAALIGSTVVYHVDERVQKDYQRSWDDGERSPGVKMFYLVRRLEGLSRDQFVDHWLHRHVPLVRQHLPGIWRYVTNVVAGALTPGAPEADGIVELNFRTKEDLEERMYDSPEGRDIMAADSRQFLSRSATFGYRTSEYVLRGLRAEG